MTTKPRSILEIRAAKDSLIGPVSFVNFLASLKGTLKTTVIKRLFGNLDTITFEIACLNQEVYFIVTCPESLEGLVKAQISAQYTDAIITPMKDYLPDWMSHNTKSIAQLTLTAPYYLPINTIKDTALDPLASVLGVLSKVPPGQAVIIQYCLSGSPSGWHKAGRSIIQKGIGSAEKPEQHPQKALIEQKLALPAFDVDIRLAAIAPDKPSCAALLSQTISAFGVYHLAESNGFAPKKLKPGSEAKLTKVFIDRSALYTPEFQHLNLLEIASLYHFPNLNLVGIKNLVWGKSLKGEPPINLPIAEGLSDEEKKQINFFAKTEYKNRMTIFGIRKGEDRRRHMYILGKSGTGKTTLIANMAISDIRNGEGVVVVDPHGDLADTLLQYIPSERINDVAFLDPSEKKLSFRMNPLYVKNPENKELVVSGLLSIFMKIWAGVWSARMEYILRNALLTLVEREGATMMDIPRLLTDKRFRDQYLLAVPDPTMLTFWRKEYDAYSEKFQAEAIAPILNKVGAFITSSTIRNVVSYPDSTIDLEDMINEGKIVILKVAQGKIGVDNSALLGAMFITQIQIAAMNRVSIAEKDRRDIFLYVDEFQNFATTSFITILSEARKFHLNLILANQYTAQLDELIQKAIFGNAGTLISFVIGADDATRLMAELGNLYTQSDLVSLVKHQVLVKMTVDSAMSTPFPAFTLPPPFSKNQNHDKVIKVSQERFYRPIIKLEAVTPPPTFDATNPSVLPPPSILQPKPLPQSHPIPTILQLDEFRQRGFKPNIVTLLVSDKKVLLCHNQKYAFWQFPQSFINNQEGLEDAVFREITADFSVDATKCVKESQELIQEDRMEFPEERQVARDLRLDNGQLTTTKGKKYFFMLIRSASTPIKLNRREYDEAKLVDFTTAEKLLSDTNQGGKLRIALAALDILNEKGMFTDNPQPAVIVPQPGANKPLAIVE